MIDPSTASQPSGTESAPDPALAEQVICSHCGVEVNDAFRYCPSCGELFEERPTILGLINRHQYPLLGLLLGIIAILAFFVVFPLRDQTRLERYNQLSKHQSENDYLPPSQRLMENDYLPPSQYLKGTVEGITLLAPRPLYHELVKAILLLKLNSPNHFKLARQYVENVHFLPIINADAAAGYRQETKTVILFNCTMHRDGYTLAFLLMHEAGHGYFHGTYDVSLDDPRFVAEQLACDQLAFRAVRCFAPVKMLDFLTSQMKLLAPTTQRCPIPVLPAIEEPNRSMPVALPDTWIDLVIERRHDPDLGSDNIPVLVTPEVDTAITTPQ